jgi:NhaP-type Na+/H+ or K+/H+ antiporter
LETSQRGKDLFISTIREFIVLTLYFEVALNMTRVTMRQNRKEIVSYGICLLVVYLVFEEDDPRMGGRWRKDATPGGRWN